MGGTNDVFSRFLEHVKCNLCGSDNYETVYKSTYTSKDFSKKKIRSFAYASSDKARGNIVKCRKCGLVYMNPRDKDINSLYQEVDDTYYFASKDDRVETFERDFWEIESVIKGKGLGKKILDVGCSYGFFLDVAEKSGWDAYGCELSKKQCQFAAKSHKNVHNKELDKCPFKKNYFDVITLYDVIEHVTDPSHLLKNCNNLLKKKGIIVICTPDVSSFVARAMGKYWLQYVRMHIYYFSPKTLGKMLEKTGFKAVKVTKHPRILRLKNAIKWTSKYPVLYSLLRLIAKNKFLSGIKFKWYIGDSITIYAEKM